MIPGIPPGCTRMKKKTPLESYLMFFSSDFYIAGYQFISSSCRHTSIWFVLSLCCVLRVDSFGKTVVHWVICGYVHIHTNSYILFIQLSRKSPVHVLHYPPNVTDVRPHHILHRPSLIKIWSAPCRSLHKDRDFKRIRQLFLKG